MQRVQDPVADDLLARDALDRDDRPTVGVVRVDQLARDGLATRVEHDVVAEQHRERLVADEILGNQDGMPQPELLTLMDEGDGPDLADPADRPQHVDVAALLQPALERGVRVEVILDRAAAGGDDDDDLVDPGGDGFLHGVLDDRPVDERHDLLGDRLGGREEASAEASGGQNRLTDARSDDETPLFVISRERDAGALGLPAAMPRSGSSLGTQVYPTDVSGPSGRP